MRAHHAKQHGQQAEGEQQPVHALQAAQGGSRVGLGLCGQLAMHDKRLQHKQHQGKHGVGEQHGVQPAGIGQAGPAIGQPQHQQAAGAHQLGGPSGLPGKAVFNGFKHGVLLSQRDAPGNGRQQHGGDHRHPANPQHHTEHMHGAGDGVMVPFHCVLSLQVMLADRSLTGRGEP